MPNIVGPHSGPKELLLTYAQSVGAKRLPDVSAFIDELYRQNWLDAFMIAVQSIHETDAWRSPYWENHLNPGGLAITFDGQASKTWANGTDAARAMLVHESAYVGTTPAEWVAWIPLDPHYAAVKEEGLWGSAQRFEDYGSGKWATDKNYYQGILTREQEVRALANVQPGTSTPNILDRYLHVAQSGYAGVERRIIGRDGMSPKIIVLHIQEGNNWGSWQHFHTVKASSTVLIGKNGDIWRLVPEQDGPWTNGDVNQPTALGWEVINQWGPDPNVYTLSIETEGYTGEWPKPQAQLNSVVWQVKQWMVKYGIPAKYVIKHADINNVDRHYCPGDAYYNYVINAVKGTVVPTVLDTPDPILVDGKPWDGKQSVTVNGNRFIAETRSVNLAKGASAYKYADTSTAVVHRYKEGDQAEVLGWVLGAKIQGDARWWITKDFYRLPVDRTAEKPEKVDTPDEPHPTEPQADLPKGAKLYNGIVHYPISTDERELEVIANANLRKAATTASPVIGSVHKGDKVKAIYWCIGAETRKERIWWVLYDEEDTLRKGARLYAAATASRPD